MRIQKNDIISQGSISAHNTSTNEPKACIYT